MNTILMNFFKGIIIGVANIIPGVSGGTIMVLLGIFDDVIESVNNFTKNIKKNAFFLLILFLGMAVGIVGFSSLITTSLEKFSFQTTMFFVGLILGSIPLIFGKAKDKGYTNFHFLGTLGGIGIVVLFSLLSNKTGGAGSYSGVTLMFVMFLAGIIASIAMVIPGISGSFILVLMGLYPTVSGSISSIKDFLENPSDIGLFLNILTMLVPLGIGVILGVLIISKVISSLLSKFHSTTYFIILGLIIGSIFAIFNDPTTYSSGVNLTAILIGIVMAIIGILVSVLLGKE